MGYAHPSPTTDRSWMDVDIVPHLVSQPLPYIVTLLMVTILAYYTWTVHFQKLPPILNAPGRFDMGNSLAKIDFLDRAASLLKTANDRFADKPVRIATDTGNLIILPPNHLAQEIRNNPNLSFFANTAEDFHGKIPGFEPFDAGRTLAVTVKVVKTQLTKHLSKLTKPVSLEASFALHNLLGESSEWREVNAAHTCVRFVSSLSSRIFLGEELCRNKLWLEATSQYTENVMDAVKKLRLFPKFSRPFVHWFLPECRQIRRVLNEARSIIQVVIDRRRAEKIAAAKEGRPIHCPNDAIEWGEASKTENYDPAVFQINLSLAAIHTTSDLLNKTMQYLVQRPELIDALRREIVKVLDEYGLTKRVLVDLKLMDSVLKETQRLIPLKMSMIDQPLSPLYSCRLKNSATMHRMALADVTLSDGTVIRKGSQCAVRSTKRFDANVYDNPNEFDGKRFLNMRNEPSKAHKAHLVSIGMESLGFGYGEHACPGRFFAANEIKIAMIHMLLKYDWKPAPDYVQRVIELGFDVRADPTARIMVRKRESELDLDTL